MLRSSPRFWTVFILVLIACGSSPFCIVSPKNPEAPTP
jgi:hypothetical protein